MAVEARRIKLLPSQFIPTTTRQVMASLEGNGSQMGQRGAGSGNFMVPPLCNSMFVEPPAAAKAYSGFTYNLNLPGSRKRTREESLVMMSLPFPGTLSLLGQDISLQIQHQQLEIDRFISHHMEKVRVEIEERRKRHWRRMIGAVEECLMKRLKAKEDEVENIGKLNWALEERVKSLCVENQIWRDLAQTNEANANALRDNLEQVLSQQVKTEQQRNTPCSDYIEMEWAEEAESCCGGENDNHKGEEEEEEMMNERKRMRRGCRNCRREEASVLLLPCRHLCLCSMCDSNLHTCPICNSTKNASVHVNLS